MPVPGEAGAWMRAEGGLGKIRAEGFQREGEAYANDARGNAEDTPTVDFPGV